MSPPAAAVITQEQKGTRQSSTGRGHPTGSVWWGDQAAIAKLSLGVGTKAMGSTRGTATALPCCQVPPMGPPSLFPGRGTPSGPQRQQNPSLCCTDLGSAVCSDHFYPRQLVCRRRPACSNNAVYEQPCSCQSLQIAIKKPVNNHVRIFLCVTLDI